MVTKTVDKGTLGQSFLRSTDRVSRVLTVGDQSWATHLEDISDRRLQPEAAWWQSFLRGAAGIESRSDRLVRVVDVFSGCGGLALGVSQAAWALGCQASFLAAIDVDPGALEVYRHNLYAKELIHRSASALVDFHVRGRGSTAEFAFEPEILDDRLRRSVGKVDLLIAGPPCQGHSNLNNRSRRDDTRNQLYLTAIALAVGLRARAVVIENVREVTSDKSEVFQSALALLSASGFGHIDHGVLAADRLGAAQTRRRYFLTAVRDPGSGGVLALSNVAEGLRAKSRPVSWAIGDVSRRRQAGPMEAIPELSPENQARIKYLFDKQVYDLPDRKRPDCHKDGTTYRSVYGRMYWDRPAQTITTGFMTPGRGRFIHPREPRVITAREAARIQFFPDSFDFTCGGASCPSKKDLSKWIGDAVPPILGYAASISAISSLY